MTLCNVISALDARKMAMQKFRTFPDQQKVDQCIETLDFEITRAAEEGHLECAIHRDILYYNIFRLPKQVQRSIIDRAVEVFTTKGFCVKEDDVYTRIKW